VAPYRHAAGYFFAVVLLRHWPPAFLWGEITQGVGGAKTKNPAPLQGPGKRLGRDQLRFFS